MNYPRVSNKVVVTFRLLSPPSSSDWSLIEKPKRNSYRYSRRLTNFWISKMYAIRKVNIPSLSKIDLQVTQTFLSIVFVSWIFLSYDITFFVSRCSENLSNRNSLNCQYVILSESLILARHQFLCLVNASCLKPCRSLMKNLTLKSCSFLDFGLTCLIWTIQRHSHNQIKFSHVINIKIGFQGVYVFMDVVYIWRSGCKTDPCGRLFSACRTNQFYSIWFQTKHFNYVMRILKTIKNSLS